MDHIVEEASNIYSRYGAENLDLVAAQLGVAVYGLLEAEDLKEAYFPELRAITVRPGLPSYERRYLIAHALGHHLFHRDGPGKDYLRLHLKRSEGASAQVSAEIARIEDEADLFAAFLLVPESRLRPLLQDGAIWKGEDPVLHLAMEFQVPVEPMRVRLAYERSRQLRHQE